MAGEIDRAIERYGERIAAASQGLQDDDEAGSLAAVRMSLSGLDLDFDELEEWIRRGVISAAIVGGTPVDWFTSGAIGGLAVGLLIAEERQKAEAS